MKILLRSVTKAKRTKRVAFVATLTALLLAVAVTVATSAFPIRVSAGEAWPPWGTGCCIGQPE